MALQFRRDPRGDQFFALRTFRGDGSAVSTPIWLAPLNGRWYGYTPRKSWKIKRISRNDHVEFARSTFHGELLEGWRPGRARTLPLSQLSVAKRALTAKYGNRFRLFTFFTFMGQLRRHGGRGVGIEITLADLSPDEQSDECERSDAVVRDRISSESLMLVRGPLPNIMKPW